MGDFPNYLYLSNPPMKYNPTLFDPTPPKYANRSIMFANPPAPTFSVAPAPARPLFEAGPAGLKVGASYTPPSDYGVGGSLGVAVAPTQQVHLLPSKTGPVIDSYNPPPQIFAGLSHKSENTGTKISAGAFKSIGPGGAVTLGGSAQIPVGKTGTVGVELQAPINGNGKPRAQLQCKFSF